MKIALIIFGVLLFIFGLAQFYFMKGQSNIEMYPYQIDKTIGKVELRSYEASLFTSVQLNDSKYQQASGKGFSILASYIFGGNDKKEKIAMTSPVSMSLQDSMTMMFMVPKQYKKDELPKPDRIEIQFHEQPERKMAAIRFGGWANDEKIEKYKQLLIAALEKNKIAYSNNFFFFGYNAPYEVANRRNEVLVELINE